MNDSETRTTLSTRRPGWLGPAAFFVVTCLAFGMLFQSLPVLYDTDSYYHLAIGRAYDRHGIIDTLPWARFSLLNEFGDKEYLFHQLLAPFADTENPTAGGRWALALLNACVATLLALLGRAAIGPWGWLAPLLVYGGSLDFLGRMIRLRPEILSLLLMLVAMACVAKGRPRWLALVAALYTLGYTAFHAFLGLAGAWFLHRWWFRRRWDWALMLYPLLGVGLGLVLHPHFPQNLVVWKVQSFDFFQQKAQLDVGLEIGAHQAPDLLLLNLGWILALLALWRSASPAPVRRQGSESRGTVESLADVTLVAAVLFGLLYLLMLRFSTYFLPFATLAVLAEMGRRRQAPGAWVRLPLRGRIPLVLALVAAGALGLPRAAHLLEGLASARGPISREADWQAFGSSLPPGAKVAADWGNTHLYMFYAPQAAFLNVLDPVFMQVRYPAAYKTLRSVLEGREPDIPVALVTELDSSFLALSRFHPHPELIRRLATDPRLRLRYQGYTLLYEIIPGANEAFVLDWHRIPQDAALPPTTDTAMAFPSLPRAEHPAVRSVEGFVSTRREDASGDDAEPCEAFVHLLNVTEPDERIYELATLGPTKLWIDDRLVAGIEGSHRARLGQGVTFPISLTPGTHRFTVLTCTGQDDDSRRGFYLLER